MNNIFQKSFAAGDIFATAYVCCMLGATENQVTLPTSSGLASIGVVQDITTVGDGSQAVPVMVFGITKVVANSAITIGDRLRCVVTTGYVETMTGLVSTAQTNQVGVALQAASAQGDIISMLLTPYYWFVHAGISSPSPSISPSVSPSKSPSISPSVSPS